MEMHTSAETPTLEKAALTVAEFSTSFSISRAALYKQWRAGGGPPRVKVGSRTLIPVATALRWLEEQVTPTKSGNGGVVHG